MLKIANTFCFLCIITVIVFNSSTHSLFTANHVFLLMLRGHVLVRPHRVRLHDMFVVYVFFGVKGYPGEFYINKPNKNK
ncbi:hypothetical protein Hanom_Chr09g00792221 [Helianthus anomalus]